MSIIKKIIHLINILENEKQLKQYKSDFISFRYTLKLLNEEEIKNKIIREIVKYNITVPLIMNEIERTIHYNYPEYNDDIKKISFERKNEIFNIMNDIVKTVTNIK